MSDNARAVEAEEQGATRHAVVPHFVEAAAIRSVDKAEHLFVQFVETFKHFQNNIACKARSHHDIGGTFDERFAFDIADEVHRGRLQQLVCFLEHGWALVFFFAHVRT